MADFLAPLEQKQHLRSCPFPYRQRAGAMASGSRSLLDAGINTSSDELPQQQQQKQQQKQQQQQDVVVHVPWMPDSNMLWLDLYHICEMMGLVGDNEYPDEDTMRGRLRDHYIQH